MQYEKFNALSNGKITHYQAYQDFKNFVAQDSVLKLNSSLSFHDCYWVAEMA